jgi:cyclopropane fatty-acyl-phospholipid synthase-like methyltransferase
MDDPVQRHPTRAEQLDILATVVADNYAAGDRLLDLGVGVGYVAHLIFAKQPAARIIGVDRKSDALTSAKDAFPNFDLTCIEGDLEAIADIAIPAGPYKAIYSTLTFHDLTDDTKQAVIAWAAAHLAPGGFFLLYDRLRMTDATLFPAQQSIWTRIEKEYGVGMRSAPDYDAYLTDLGTDNRPASLDDYQKWFAEAGLAFQILHLHGNVALMAGARK